MKQFHMQGNIPLRAAALLALLLVSGCMLTAAARYSAPEAVNAAGRADVAAASAKTDGAAGTGALLLKSSGGMVCIYEDGALRQRTDIPVASLPAQDRADLEAGIPVADEQALHRLLEDLGS